MSLTCDECGEEHEYWWDCELLYSEREKALFNYSFQLKGQGWPGKEGKGGGDSD